MNLLWPVLCWVAFQATWAELVPEPNSARLLLRKTIASPAIVANKDFAVHYEIINTGTSTAYDIALDDTKSWPESQFERRVGLLAAQWRHLAPGSRVTHVVFLRAKARGPMSPREAHISYLDGRDGNVRSGFSNGVPPSMITTATDYERRHGLHLLDWSVFSVLALGLIGIPALAAKQAAQGANF